MIKKIQYSYPLSIFNWKLRVEEIRNTLMVLRVIDFGVKTNIVTNESIFERRRQRET